MDEQPQGLVDKVLSQFQMPRERRWLWGAVMSFFAFILVATATRGELRLETLFLIAVLAVSLGIIYRAFPGSRFFYLALTNCVTVYVCLFEVFHEVVYPDLPLWMLQVGFILPLAAFIGGSLIRRKKIRSFVEDASLQHRIHDRGAFGWLFPVILVGVVTVIFVKSAELTMPYLAWVFLGAMSLIALIVLRSCVQICSFFVETGLLFEEFFQLIRRAAVPVFAFITFYSIQVIVFGCIYRVADGFSAAHLFLVRGESQAISFSDALYFSLITVSTVGYGDIIPNNEMLRGLVSIQVVLGVLLIIFGVAEIQRLYSLTRDRYGR